METQETERLAPDLRPLAFPVADLNFAPDNARSHSERDVPVLVESLRRFGQRKPIVAKREYRRVRNAVLAGNGTLTAAQRLGWTEIAVAWFEGTDDEARQYALADNRTAELSEWNFEVLSAQLSDLASVDADLPGLLGWSDGDLSPLLAATWERPDAEPLPAEGDVPEPSATVILSAEQHRVVQQAIARVRDREHDRSLTAGRCLELICGDFLSGPYPGA